MNTFRYNDMRVRYKFMLALASCQFVSLLLSALSLALQSTRDPMFLSVFYACLAVPDLVLIFIALRALRYGVEFTDQALYLDSKRIPFDRINRVKYSDDDLGFTVCYGEFSSRSAFMGLRESDADIETFRQAARELAAQVKLRQPKAKVQSPVGFATPGTKVYGRMDERILEEKSKIKGIGGWLIYLAFDLVVTVFMQIQTAVSAIRTIASASVFTGSLAAALVNALVILFTVLFAIVLFIQLLGKRPRFTRWYPWFNIAQLIAVRVVSLLQFALAVKPWPNVFSLCSTFVVSLAYGIIFFFAWKAYFARSIRVKNTFGASQPGADAGVTG